MDLIDRYFKTDKDILNKALKEINKLEKEVYCNSKFGDCIKGTNQATDILDKYNIPYIVKQDYIETNKIFKKGHFNKDSIEHRESSTHTWAELLDGTIIDITKSQFDKSKGIYKYKVDDFFGTIGKSWNEKEYKKLKEKEIGHFKK